MARCSAVMYDFSQVIKDMNKKVSKESIKKSETNAKKEMK